MKKILGEFLNNQETPEGTKDRLLESARSYLLLKDLGELFISNIPKASFDFTSTVVRQGTETKQK